VGKGTEHLTRRTRKIAREFTNVRETDRKKNHRGKKSADEKADGGDGIGRKKEVLSLEQGTRP